MKPTDLNEITFIETLQKQFTNNKLDSKHIIGIGDDCAVIPKNHSESFLVTTDSLVEGIHFLSDYINPKDLAHKTIAVNLSDIAAMGGTPCYLFLSISLPKNTHPEWLKAFTDALFDSLKHYNVQLLGGDTTGSLRDIMINATVIGISKNATIKLRSAAKPNDLICVTDDLGDALAGFMCLKKDVKKTREARYLIDKHLRPTPKLLEGQFLASHKTSSIHAMMDLSDGLSMDMQRICNASICSANIQLERLPISDELNKLANILNHNPFEIAAIGGEDYGLLLTMDPAHYDTISKEFKKTFHKNLTVIGEIIASPTPDVLFSLHGKPYRLTMKSFSHF